MDLLKDITQGLRGETRRNDRGRGSGGSRRDRDRRSATKSTTGAADEPGGEDDADEDASGSGEQSREDEHVCSFCGAEFDASRGVCPECDAEIVLRGER